MIDIISNGSHWAGEAPDTIEQLKEVFKTHTLDKTFEEYGNFVRKIPNENMWRLFGNFLDISHVFQITTDEKTLVNEIRRLIRENKKRPEYIAQ